MQRVAGPLIAMGARVDFEGAENHSGLPVRVIGAPLQAVEWNNEHSSAQVKSAILLAALMSGSEAEVTESHPSRDHTERMLSARGVNITMNEHSIGIRGKQSLVPLDVDVPGDPSSATFFVALASLASSGELRLVDVCLNPSRIGALVALRRMGARVQVEDERTVGGEAVGTIVVTPANLVGTEIGGGEIPTLIDELPMIACVAARAEGETRVTGASELRVKESDRITAVVDNLRAIGGDADELPDGFVVRGHQRALSGRVVTHGDHRLAMAFGILGALPGNNIAIDDRDCVDVSFPAFWKELHCAISSDSDAARRNPLAPR